MSDHKTCRLRVVAYKTEEWTSVDRPPLTELVHCDLVVPDIMLLFAENHLRLGAMESNTYFPRIAFVAALDETVFHIGETSPNLASAIHDDPRPDYIIAHGTAGLRMLMAPHIRLGKWLCTHRIARQVWPNAPSFNLPELINWRSLCAHVINGRTDWVGRETLNIALLTTLLLIDLLEVKSIYSLQVLSTNFQWPFAPAPSLGDAVGWAKVPDDDLTWLSRVSESQLVQERALVELERRRRFGLATPLLGQPPTYFGEEGRIAALS